MMQHMGFFCPRSAVLLLCSPSSASIIAVNGLPQTEAVKLHQGMSNKGSFSPFTLTMDISVLQSFEEYGRPAGVLTPGLH